MIGVKSIISYVIYKMDIFVGGANVKQVSEAEDKAEVMKLNMAALGQCLKAHP